MFAVQEERLGHLLEAPEERQFCQQGPIAAGISAHEASTPQRAQADDAEEREGVILLVDHVEEPPVWTRGAQIGPWGPRSDAATGRVDIDCLGAAAHQAAVCVESLDAAGEILRLLKIVVGRPFQQLTPCELDAAVEVACDPDVRVVAHVAHSLVTFGERTSDLPGPVGGGVGHHQQLEGLIGLCQQRLECSAEIALPVVDGKPDGDARPSIGGHRASPGDSVAAGRPHGLPA
jgi:hypothetical protein